MFDSTLFLLQLALIIGTARVVAWIFRRLGQTQVVGEMAAGIFLGPTLFGHFAPQWFEAVFPASSLVFLTALSQVGLVIFVFLVGVRTDFAELRVHSRLAAATSVVGILVPLALGGLLGLYLFPVYGHGNQLAFALFVGTAISVTAFPVLARILMERNMLNTRIGTLAIACAAAGDFAAWTLLTFITVITHQSRSSFPLIWMGPVIAGYAACALALRAVLSRISVNWKPGTLPISTIAVLLVLAMLSAALTEWIGLHALIGAFVVGLMTPRTVRKELVDHLEPATLILLIPIFFALTGIKANLVFPAGSGAYTDLLLILVIAVASKWGAATATSRIMGLSWSDASQLGLLLNTRGLVELIVLNVGLEAGIISQRLFSLMVCMALVTTMMATPVMDLLRRRESGGITRVAAG